MKKPSKAGVIFPAVLFILACAAIIAVFTAPRESDAEPAATPPRIETDLPAPETPADGEDPVLPETEADPKAETEQTPEPIEEPGPTSAEETEASPAAEPDPDPQPEPEPQSEPEPEPEKDPEPVSEPESQPEPESEPAADPLAAFSPEVRAQIAAMSERELLTQMFIATYDGSWATAGYAAEYGFGGYITFAEDYADDTPESFRAGVDRVTASSAIPPLYAVDEEGGTVTRASKYSWYRAVPFASPRDVYAWGGIDGIRVDAAEKANLLKSLGLNYNLAPVADISVNASDYMYSRSPGQDAETTSQIVETIVGEFNKKGVATTVKHFPGYGAVSDTHVALAWDGRSVAELEAFDLIPFQRAMDAGVPSVMVSHIITALDPERPASVSSAVVDYIRGKMGYDGVLITDDMRMNGILDFCTSGNGSLEAILAGYDLICCTNWPEQFPVVWAAVERGEISRERLEISAARILRMKQELGIWVP
ncbi:MAG: beta-hexosaminidase [Clostridia bacterium]|nr:beta-hexosaminidase [Clostridia bacterium]